MELSSGSPFRGGALEELKSFLRECSLDYDEQVEYSVCLADNGEMAATGSLDGYVLKCLAVSPKHASEGLAARIVSELVNEAARRRRFHLFLFTKPENEELFGGLGFYRVAKTNAVLLMENKKHGIQQFVAELRTPDDPLAGAGAIVANCNPFTLGHQYLIETAAKQQCDPLYLFIVSEDRCHFSAEARLQLVRLGTAHLPNLRICPTGPYLVSAATFPDYFLKDSPGAVSPRTLNTELDIAIFAECFARPLGISRRFVGTEPLDEVTAVYNEQMKMILPSYGIGLVEIPRLEHSGAALSASRVRSLLDEGNIEAVREMVPQGTYEFLKNGGGRVEKSQP